jgi:hypothetical protein
VAPFVTVYLVVSWLLFLPAAHPVRGNFVIDNERVRPFLFHIPDLGDAPATVLVALPTAPWINHNAVQLAYVTALLLLIGLVVEAHEGTARTAAFFFGTTCFGAIVAGSLLHLLYPEIWRGAFIEREWNQVWSGGSVGGYGLMGLLAARARRPELLLVLVVLWETNLFYWYLREYTPVFHLAALLGGFVAARFLVAPVAEDCRQQVAPDRTSRRGGRVGRRARSRAP